MINDPAIAYFVLASVTLATCIGVGLIINWARRTPR
jgi:hypothetical protein